MGKIVIFSAPSGSGKTTIVRELLKRFPQFEFSVSATSRAPRGQERDGVDYYFLSNEEFMNKVAEGAFVEWEEVYAGRYYGTLKSEIDRIVAGGHNVVLDIDVKGAMNVKSIYGDRALALFIMPPSIEELRRRLESRATDAPEVIDERVAKAAYELSFATRYDARVVNDELSKAVNETHDVIAEFLVK